MITAIHGDCLEAMREMKDNEFDLAICDPPYGIGIGKNKKGMGRRRGNPGVTYKMGEWDNEIPRKEYFTELQRISKNQIVFGGNYFTEFLPPKPKFFIWDKMISDKLDQAMAEYAWVSIENVQTKIFRRSLPADNNCISNGDKRAMSAKRRIHPTQKPVKLYEWILINYAEEGDKILDTHGGSFSHAIACHNLNFDLTIYEIDKDYFDAGMKRLQNHQAQLTMF